MTQLLVIFAILVSVLVGQTPPPPPVHTSVTITAKVIEPQIDNRNAEVFNKTLFSRDDQVFQQLNAGINAGQHEGGGKSIEIRRFGFNLDHGGVNGGLKVLVDNVQQNQTTQGHGQGYLGSLKSLSPELIEEATIINGPFSAEYGDFSGLGVVHIRLREAFPDLLTGRIQGGSFNTQRGFLAFSPNWRNIDSFIAYEGSNTDGPFVKPLDYRRDNLTANFTRRLTPHRMFAIKMNGGLNRYNSSGHIPLSEVMAGRLDRFGYLDSGEGGNIRSGTVSGYLRQETEAGAVIKIDAFVTRSLFDLYSNFTFFLNDPVEGDAIQQHDSRLVNGANFQYQRARFHGLFTAGINYHDNNIRVGLYPRVGRNPVGITSLAHAHVTSGAGYMQQNFSLLHDRLTIGAGLRYDAFRFDVRDRVDPLASNTESSGRIQPKLSAAYKLFANLPLTLHANYGRGVSSIDARSILTNRNGVKLANTDFSQLGLSSRWNRLSLAVDGFYIARSNELVYIADDGTLEFFGPSRSYGFEAKASLAVTRHINLNGGLTKVGNSYYVNTNPRRYVDRAPHFTADAGITVTDWRGWSGSLRLRAINGYMLDGDHPSIRASGNTVLDLGVVRRLSRKVDLSFSVDNLTDRSYYETQNYIESRPYSNAPAAYGIHATPGYPLTATVGLTFRLGAKN